MDKTVLQSDFNQRIDSAMAEDSRFPHGYCRTSHEEE